MSFLNALRMAVLVVIAVVSIAFAVLNPAERVQLDLFFWPPLENVPLVFALFCAFLLGLGGGLAISVMRMLEMQGRLRELQRSRHRIEGELTTLRNLPLEESEETPEHPAP